MKRNFSRRIAKIEDSIFAVMSKLAYEYKAINLGQGFPDFDGPKWIMDEAYSSMLGGKNQYAPTVGINSLRKEIKRVYKLYYDMDLDIEANITVTAGATEALFCAVNALVEEGDEVILFEPFYDAYYSDVLLAGGVPRFVTLKKPDFSFDFDELSSLINEKTKLIVVNNPHNPTGKVFSRKELEFIAELARAKDIFVISDEVYEFLTFDSVQHIPIITLPEMFERVISISSTGKTFSMTGWKIGFAVANEKITDAIRKVHQWTTFAVNTPAQHAMAFAFSKLEEYLPEFKQFYQAKRDLVLEELSHTKFKAFPPYGSYFLMVEFPESSNRSDFDCAIDLVKNYGVATIPPSVFYKKSEEGKTMLRLCFAKNNETIIEGIRRLKEYK